MYALTYGTEGVVHAIEGSFSPHDRGTADSFCPVLRDEIETTLRLLGVTKLSQLGPHLVSASCTILLCVLILDGRSTPSALISISPTHLAGALMSKRGDLAYICSVVYFTMLLCFQVRAHYREARREHKGR